MGADGAIKLRRKELVNTKADTATKSPAVKGHQNEAIWGTCRLSGKPLDEPVMSDYKGYLYNKQALLEYFLDKESITEAQRKLISHIGSISKDLIELKISKNDSDEFICPITGTTLGVKGQSFIYLSRCGHVLAQKCLKQFAKECPVCSVPYVSLDIVMINPTDDQNEERLEALKDVGLYHSLKKRSKSDKGKPNKKPKTTIA